MIISTPLLSQIPALRSLWKDSFGDTDSYLDTFFQTAFHPDRCRVVTDDNQVVAALYWFSCTYHEQPIAYIYAVATDKQYQGRGICHKLMEDTHTHLRALGYQGTVLVPGNEGLFRFYESMGYIASGTLHTFTCSAGEQALPLTRIDCATYADLRRQFLPNDSVLQEQENLDFLQTQAEFFKGNGFLLTARKEGTTLYGLELLGDTSSAPGIVAAFDCAQGTFRTPGTNQSFSMTYSFYSNTPIHPTYFAFAFD